VARLSCSTHSPTSSSLPSPLRRRPIKIKISSSVIAQFSNDTRAPELPYGILECTQSGFSRKKRVPVSEVMLRLFVP
jgi:hypothetical protein